MNPTFGLTEEQQLAVTELIHGKNIDEAIKLYPSIRVYVKDGEEFFHTEDYCPHRVNVETQNNIIIKIVSFS